MRKKWGREDSNPGRTHPKGESYQARLRPHTTEKFPVYFNNFPLEGALILSKNFFCSEPTAFAVVHFIQSIRILVLAIMQWAFTFRTMR